MDAKSSDGLSITVDVSVRFRPIVSKLPVLHEQIGENYKNTIVKDVLRSSVRKIFSSYALEEIYSTERAMVEQGIAIHIDSMLTRKYIQMEATLIRGIKLPPSIEESIQEKLQQEQEAKKYEFRLQAEKLEAERKRIEGTAVFCGT